MENSEKQLITNPKYHLNPSDILDTDRIKIFTFLNQPSFSKSTKENYSQILKKFFEFHNNSKIKDITDVHINLYLKSIDKKPATKNLILKALSSMFGFLVRTGYLKKNPTATIKLEKVADLFRSKILDFEQIRRMMEFEKSPRNKILLKILYYAGLRISEALNLTPKSFRVATDGGVYMTVLGKGTKVRTIYLPADIFVEIDNYIKLNQFADDEFLFFAKEKTQSMTRMQAFRVIRLAAIHAKVDPIPSPHWFRHSSATHAIENGAPIHVVQQSLGHASIDTTGKYLHASPTKSNANFLKKKVNQE